MVNHRLRAAINAADLSYEQIGTELEVSPKTVERWITKGRVPYPRHRHRLVTRLGQSEPFFWPDLFQESTRPDGTTSNDVVGIYPLRTSVPDQVWQTLLAKARKRIDLLAYSGRFLFDRCPDLATVLTDRADAGTTVRITLGDPDCAVVAERGRELGVGGELAAEIRDVADRYRDLAGHPAISLTFHETTLYTSILQCDDDMLVTTHVYGLSADHSPTIHLHRRSRSPLFETYISCFEQIWQNARI